MRKPSKTSDCPVGRHSSLRLPVRAFFLFVVLISGLLGDRSVVGSPRGVHRPPDDRTYPLRTSPNTPQPAYGSRIHFINDIWMNLTSEGMIGAGREYVGSNDGAWAPATREDLKRLGITWHPSFEFPPRTQNDYLNQAQVLFGCVHGVDTIMTMAFDWTGFSGIRESSMLRTQPGYSSDAVADQQFYIAYDDTNWYTRRYYDPDEGRRHLPTGVEIHQTSYAWSFSFAKRFIIIDYRLVNTTDTPIGSGTFGLWFWPFVFNDALYDGGAIWINTQIGFMRTAEGMIAGTTDTVNVAWFADNDGNPIRYSQYDRECPTGAVGIRILRTPPGGRPAFNWYYTTWTGAGSRISWGPYRRGSGLYGDGYGEPYGDRGWYRMMINGEIDYDQMYAAIDKQAEGWGPPSRAHGLGEQIARGVWSELVISAGPFDPIPPHDSAAFTIALIAGERFHHKPRNLIDNFNPYDPEDYRANLDFSDMILSARWADWMFDTPGFDTDGDGNRGRAYGINCDAFGCDSVYYKGDGIPDWTGPRPPIAPGFGMTTRPGSVLLRWSGALPETEIDGMSGVRDFEGYRVYAGRFNTDDRLSLIASWDREDYKRMLYVPEKDDWVAISHPYPPDKWATLMNDESFDPRDYSVPSLQQAYVDSTADTITNSVGQMWILWSERYSYWEKQDYNRGNEFTEIDGNQRNLIQQVETRDTVIDDEALTYGFYEIEIDNLNPSVPLYFALTTFDFGNNLIGLEPLESSPANNCTYAEPIYSADVVVDSALKVSVFPNPYKLAYRDGHGEWTSYYEEGYEGRGIHQFEEQDRRVHFINLPDTATITIYTLDGDLVRTIHHPDPFLTTYPSSVGWDLVTRNVQAVVSGIYIWRVESRLGVQTGKLVIIK